MDRNGQVIWITGLSGSGKSTLAHALLPHMPGAILLDGDALRTVLGAEKTDFDPAGRKRLAFTYARLAALLARQGFTVLVATISLFHDLHAWNRENLPGYVEIFLDVPEHIRRQRDPKGLYAKQATDSAASPLAGVDYTAELPLAPHLHFHYQQSPAAMAAAILEYIHA